MSGQNCSHTSLHSLEEREALEFSVVIEHEQRLGRCERMSPSRRRRRHVIHLFGTPLGTRGEGLQSSAMGETSSFAPVRPPANRCPCTGAARNCHRTGPTSSACQVTACEPWSYQLRLTEFGRKVRSQVSSTHRLNITLNHGSI